MVVSRRFHRALCSPGFVVRAFKVRYGECNIIAGFLDFPSFMSSDVLVNALLYSISCNPPCRIYVERLFSKCLSRSDRTTLLLKVAGACERWYSDLTISPQWSAEMNFTSLCWQTDLDATKISSCLTKHRIPYNYIFDNDRAEFTCLTAPERAIILFPPETLQLSDLRTRLFVILNACDPCVFDAFVALYRRSSEFERRNCNISMRSLCVKYGNCVPVPMLWNIHSHFPTVLTGLAHPEGTSLSFLRIATVTLCSVSATEKLFSSGIATPLDVDVRWFVAAWRKGKPDVPATRRQVKMLAFLQSRGISWTLRDRRTLAQLILKETSLGEAHQLWDALDRRDLRLELSLETLCRMLSRYQPPSAGIVPARDWDNARRGFEHAQYPNHWTQTFQRSVNLLQNSAFRSFCQTHLIPRSVNTGYFLSTQ